MRLLEQQLRLQSKFQAFFNSKKLRVKNSLLEIVFLTFGILTFRDLRYWIYSKNLSELTVFLIIAATQIPTKKLIKETPIALTVKANALTDNPPLITPHFKFLNSLLLVDFEYL